MMKSFKFAAAAAALLLSGLGVFADGGTQTADEAKSRMDDLAKVFGEKGIGSFDFANGHGFGGTHSERRGDTPESKDNASALVSEDGRAPIICISDGKYVVNQLQPTLVNTSAVEGANIWRDDVGIAMVGKIVQALRESKDGVATVKFVESTKGVNEARQGRPEEEKFKLLAYSSAKLLGKKNDSGAKFFCATRYVGVESTDELDHDRMTDADKPDGYKKAAHKKKDAKKEAPAKKDEPKKEEAKKEVAKKA